MNDEVHLLNQPHFQSHIDGYKYYKITYVRSISVNDLVIDL